MFEIFFSQAYPSYAEGMFSRLPHGGQSRNMATSVCDIPAVTLLSSSPPRSASTSLMNADERLFWESNFPQMPTLSGGLVH